MNVEGSLELVVNETTISPEQAERDYEMYAAEIQKRENLNGEPISSRVDIARSYAIDVISNYRTSVTLQEAGYKAKTEPIVKINGGSSETIGTPEKSGQYTKARPSITNGYSRGHRAKHVGSILGGM